MSVSRRIFTQILVHIDGDVLCYLQSCSSDLKGG